MQGGPPLVAGRGRGGAYAQGSLPPQGQYYGGSTVETAQIPPQPKTYGDAAHPWSISRVLIKEAVVELSHVSTAMKWVTFPEIVLPQRSSGAHREGLGWKATTWSWG